MGGGIQKGVDTLDYQYIIKYYNIYMIMKRQNLHPYDSTLLGLDNQYIPMGVDRFYINSPSIIADEQIIITGASYTIINAKHECIIVQPAKLIDVYHDGIHVNLIMEDIYTGMCFTLKLSFCRYPHFQTILN